MWVTFYINLSCLKLTILLCPIIRDISEESVCEVQSLCVHDDRFICHIHNLKYMTGFFVCLLVSDCCEGDILLLLDSGDVSSSEFSKLLHFLSELLRPFLLGRGQVRVGLVQVGNKPGLEFGLDTYNTQNALQEALRRTQQFRGYAHIEEALRLAERTLSNDGQAEAPPTILLWLADGVGPREVEGPMAALRRQGVSVLVISTGTGNYYMLRNVVTPPTEKHLYFVDADDIIIITEDLREAIIRETQLRYWK